MTIVMFDGDEIKCNRLDIYYEGDRYILLAELPGESMIVPIEEVVRIVRG